MKKHTPVAILFLSISPSLAQSADTKIYPGSMCRPISSSSHKIEYIQTFITNNSDKAAHINCPIIRDNTTGDNPTQGSYIIIQNKHNTTTTCSLISQSIYGRKNVSTKTVLGGPYTTTSVGGYQGFIEGYILLANKLQNTGSAAAKTEANLASLYLELASQTQSGTVPLSTAERFAQLVETAATNVGPTSDPQSLAEEFIALANNATNPQISENSAVQRIADQFLQIAEGRAEPPVSTYGIQKISFNTIPAKSGDSYTITCKIPPFASILNYHILEN